jgi:hypothetical protein
MAPPWIEVLSSKDYVVVCVCDVVCLRLYVCAYVYVGAHDCI